MTLYAIIEKLKMLALKHPNVNSAYEGNIYDIMNANPQQKYASVVLTQQSHTQDDTYDHYGFNLFYVDRLVDDLDTNRVQIQSTGKSMLSNIIKAFCEEFDAECETINYQTFTERFADECAGVYCTITIDMVKDIYCTEKYWDESWVTPLITVRNQNKSVVFAANGTYTVTYDATNYSGLGKVEVEVNVPDLNGSYDEGYSEGKTDGIQEGYADGKADGIEEGYSQGKTDGFNEGKAEGYDEGYDVGYSEGVEEGTSNAGGIIAETAQVLNITENGLYTTKYTTHEDLGLTDITGYFDDGTPFYDYAQLTGKIFKTDIMLQYGSSVEIWWKPDFNFSGGYYGDGIFSTLDSLKDFSISFRTLTTGQQIQANIESVNEIVKHEVEDKWYHFILKESGLVMDGETITSHFSGAYVNNKHLYINTFNNYNTVGSANGYYGMIKIDGNTFIPTENGFINQTTNTPLEVYQDGDYKFFGVPETENNLIRTVNVNIVPNINVGLEKISLGHSQITKVPDWLNIENTTSLDYLFYYCQNLTEIPYLDLSKVKSVRNMFYFCTKLKTLPLLDTSNVTDFYGFIRGTYLTTIPPFDTTSAKDISYMLNGCTKLESIPAFNVPNLTSKPAQFFGSSTFNNLTDFGGFIGLKYSMDDNYGFTRLPNLSYESCINVLNGLYDFTGNGVTPTSSQGKLKVSQSFMDKLSEEDLQIATGKGWQLLV